MQITVQMSQEEYKEFVEYTERKNALLISLRKEKQFFVDSIKELEQMIKTELPHKQLYRVGGSSNHYYELKDK